MSSVTDKTEASSTDTDDAPDTQIVPAKGGNAPPSKPAATGSGSGGFFSIYKKGQGKWTRWGTWIAVGLIVILTAHFFYVNLQVWLGSLLYTAQVVPAGASVAEVERIARVNVDAQIRAASLAQTIAIATGAAVLVGGAILIHLLTNKPKNADFLIATDSEMRKVNWTSRKELIGSTKVVIGFMFLIAFLLFAMDIIFGYAFYLMNVLYQKPF